MFVSKWTPREALRTSATDVRVAHACGSSEGVDIAANLPRHVSGETSWTSFGVTQSRLSHDSSWVSSHSLSFPSAAGESAIGGLSAAQRREVSGTASSAEKHNVLDPNGTSEDVAERRGRKAWLKGVAERRGRKTCLPESQDFFSNGRIFLGISTPRDDAQPCIEDDTDGGVHLQGKVVLYGEQRQRTSRPKESLRFVTAVSNKMSEIERDSALRLWRELSCDWSGPSVLALCGQGFRVPGRRLYSLCSVVSLLVSVLLVVGARSTRVDDDRATNTIVWTWFRPCP